MKANLEALQGLVFSERLARVIAGLVAVDDGQEQDRFLDRC